MPCAKMTPVVQNRDSDHYCPGEEVIHFFRTLTPHSSVALIEMITTKSQCLRNDLPGDLSGACCWNVLLPCQPPSRASPLLSDIGVTISGISAFQEMIPQSLLLQSW